MKYLDKGVIYITIDQNTTKEEIESLKSPYIEKGHTVVLLRSGKQNIKKTISNLLNASL